MSAPLYHGTYRGSHDGERVTITATWDGSQALPYAWECTCGTDHRFPTAHDSEVSAWRHAHPTRWDRWKRVMRRLQLAFTRSRRSPES
ncbi:hypothetical protein SAZ11_08635 [Streptomyces sp. FXJ1.4098]|nr:hypothetical protein [Streptomyces sp. FXJ1.4098]